MLNVFSDYINLVANSLNWVDRNQFAACLKDYSSKLHEILADRARAYLYFERGLCDLNGFPTLEEGAPSISEYAMEMTAAAKEQLASLVEELCQVGKVNIAGNVNGDVYNAARYCYSQLIESKPVLHPIPTSFFVGLGAAAAGGYAMYELYKNRESVKSFGSTLVNKTCEAAQDVTTKLKNIF